MSTFNNNNDGGKNNNREWAYSLQEDERRQNVVRFYKALQYIDNGFSDELRLSHAKHWETEAFEKAPSKTGYDHFIGEKFKNLTKHIQRKQNSASFQQQQNQVNPMQMELQRQHQQQQLQQLLLQQQQQQQPN